MLLSLEEELVAVTVLRSLPVVIRLDLDAIQGAGLCGIRIGIERGGEVLDVARASQGCGDEVLKEDGEAEGAGVHHAVLLQNGKQVGGAGNGLVRLYDDGVEGLLGGHALLFALIGLSRDVAKDGEDSALNRLADSLESNLDGAAKRGGDMSRSGGLGCTNKTFGDAAKNLGGDDAGVAAGAHQGTVGDGTSDSLHIGIDGKGGKLLNNRLEGKGHVGAGISIGHGEHVELVDFLCLLSNRAGGDGKTGANGLCDH